MKRLSILIACLAIATASTFAQSENPRGLYRLQRFGYVNGWPDKAPINTQYKYCTDVVPMTVVIFYNTPTEVRYGLQQDDSRPYNYTGDVAVGQDGLGTRIYDSDSEHFTLKRYNRRSYNADMFPSNEFIIEYYDRKDIEPQMQRSFEMLEMKHKQPTHRFAGCWRRVGNYGLVDGERMLVKPEKDFYKIYGEKDVTFFYNSMRGTTVEYKALGVESETCIKEGDNNECTITWRNTDSFTLKFDRGDGTIVEELWKRSGLPKVFQTLFGIDIPVYDVQIPSGF